MRRLLVIACAASLVLTGCATHPAVVIPPDVDRAELAAAIARNAQGTPDPRPPVVETPMDRVTTVVVGVPLLVGVCILAAPVYLLLAFLNARSRP
jgi:hypothetical protein